MLPVMEERSPGIPFMGIFQAFTGPRYCPKPTALQMRKQIYDFAHFGASLECRAAGVVKGYRDLIWRGASTGTSSTCCMAYSAGSPTRARTRDSALRMSCSARASSE